MKKALVVGAASVALAALPVVATFADVVDTVKVTINDNCTLSRESYGTSSGVTNNPSHKNGTGGTWSTTAGQDILTTTMTNGSTQANLGSSQFKVVCNNGLGYKVTVQTTSLSGGTGTTAIPNNTDYSASKSGWSPVSGSTKLTNGGTVTNANAATAGTVFEVSYGVGISTTQAAGTYTGTATYSLTKLTS